MKNVFLLVVFMAFTSSVTCFAGNLVSCKTSDGTYQLNIASNRGQLIATVQQTIDHEVVAAYIVTASIAPSSSFGSKNYIDQKTKGSQFDLSGPSTNDPTTSLTVKLQAGDRQEQILRDAILDCSIFK